MHYIINKVIVIAVVVVLAPLAFSQPFAGVESGSPTSIELLNHDDCIAGEFPKGIDATGAAEGCARILTTDLPVGVKLTTNPPFWKNDIADADPNGLHSCDDRRTIYSYTPVGSPARHWMCTETGTAVTAVWKEMRLGGPTPPTSSVTFEWQGPTAVNLGGATLGCATRPQRNDSAFNWNVDCVFAALGAYLETYIAQYRNTPKVDSYTCNYDQEYGWDPGEELEWALYEMPVGSAALVIVPNTTVTLTHPPTKSVFVSRPNHQLTISSGMLLIRKTKAAVGTGQGLNMRCTVILNYYD